MRLDDASWVHDDRIRMSDAEFGGTNLSEAPKSSRVLQHMAFLGEGVDQRGLCEL